MKIMKILGTGTSAGIKKWKAIISIDNQNYHLGRFLTELEAHNAIINFKKQKQLI